jgi:hypothetical protein
LVERKGTLCKSRIQVRGIHNGYGGVEPLQ